MNLVSFSEKLVQRSLSADLSPNFFTKVANIWLFCHDKSKDPRVSLIQLGTKY